MPEILRSNLGADVRDLYIAKIDRAVFDELSRLGIRAAETDSGDHAHNALAVLDGSRRQGCPEAAFFERGARRRRCLIGRGTAMDQSRRFGCQNLFRFVDFRAFELGKPFDLVERKHREQLQKARDIGVVGIAPILPIFVSADLIGIEPDRAGGGLAHLGA